MRQHHALRKSGGAAGIEDAGQILAAETGVFARGARCDQLFVIQPALRRPAAVAAAVAAAVTHVNQIYNAFGLFQDARHGGLEAVIDEDGLGAGIVQRIGVFRRRPAYIHRHDDRSAPETGVIIFEITIRIERQDGDAVARFDAEIAQGPGQSGDALGEPAPALAALAAYRRDAVAVGLRVGFDALREIHDQYRPALASPIELPITLSHPASLRS